MPAKQIQQTPGQPPARAITRLIELMESEDERVAAVACNSILDRAFGKPAPVKEEQKDSIEQRIANMTRKQRLAHIAVGPLRTIADSNPKLMLLVAMADRVI